MSSSQIVRYEGEMVPEFMSVDLFRAAINGTMRMPTVAGENQQHQKLGDLMEMGHYPTDQAQLQHVTHSRDTLLHLLVTNNSHNDIAFSVFGSDMSLLGAQNMMLETPLHIAAKVGNNDFISSLIKNHLLNVKEALKKRNKEGDTAMHVAVKYGCADVGLSLMECGPEVAYEVNDEMLSPLNIAIIKGNLKMVGQMLGVNYALASTPFSDGMFPVHVAARMGQTEMVMHFILGYPDAAKLLDPRGRNLLHIATEEGQNLAAEVDRKLATKKAQNLAAEVDWKLDAEVDWQLATKKGQALAAEVDRKLATEEGQNFVKEMLKTMNYGMDYEGNSLLHVAAMKGHLSLMKDIWEKYNGQGDEKNTHGLTPILSLMKDIWEKYNGLTPIKKNTHGLTPIDLFLRQLRATTKVDDSLARTIDQKKLSRKWFNDAMQLSLENQWERTQVIGLGSVLIITVTFAAAFTIPGGYNQNNGTPLLGRSYMFRAFIIANTLAFIYGFLSLYILLKRAAEGRPGLAHLFAIDTFLLAAYSMLLAFGLGLYVTLASVCRPIAIIILCITFLISFVNNINVRSDNYIIGLASYIVTILAIFGLPKV